jgi:hypothetical protein
LGSTKVLVVQDQDDFVPTCSEPIAEFSDRGSADAIAGILEGENVRTKVEPAGFPTYVPSSYRVLVDPRQAHRARWILQETEISESELSYLATGELGREPDSEF